MVTANPKTTIDTHKKVKATQTQHKRLSSNLKRREQKRKGGKRTYRNKPKSFKKMAIHTYISIITLNVHGLNALTKRHRLAEWIKKQQPYIGYLQENHFRPRDTYILKVRGWKEILHANGSQKKAGIAILISDKKDFKIKNVTREKEGHYIMIKGSIPVEYITTEVEKDTPCKRKSKESWNSNTHIRQK